MAGKIGPFRNDQRAANGVIFAKRTWLHSYTVANGSGAAVTVTYYDNIADDGTNPIETIVVPAGQSQANYPDLETLNGLSVRCSAWASVTLSSRWTPA